MLLCNNLETLEKKRKYFVHTAHDRNKLTDGSFGGVSLSKGLI